MDQTLGTLVLVFGVAWFGPLLADHLRRWVRIPSVVLEIALGILIGPALLGWAHEAEFVSDLSELGLATLMFMAGFEIELERVRGRPMRCAVGGWGLSLVIAAALTAPFLIGASQAWLVVSLAMATTALGTILPIIRDEGEIEGRFGTYTLATGSVGEFGPIVVIALLLSGNAPLHAVLTLAGFAMVAVLSAGLALRPRPPRLARLITQTLGTSSQLAVRLAVLLIVVMVWVANSLRLDVLLGAFTAGLVARMFLSGGDDREHEVVTSKLEALAFGFLVPFFFVVTGMRFELQALYGPNALLVPAFLVAFLAVRGIPAMLVYRKALPRPRNRAALGLFSSAQLPLVVVITGIGVQEGAISEGTAAAMVGAGMLSVLVYPLIAMRLRRAQRAIDSGSDVSVAT